jgi:MoxR-like ATPase
LQKIFTKKDLYEISSLIDEIYVDDKIYEYIKNLVFYTRYSDTKISKYLNYPVSPRASLALLKTSKALAFLE